MMFDFYNGPDESEDDRLTKECETAAWSIRGRIYDYQALQYITYILVPCGPLDYELTIGYWKQVQLNLETIASSGRF